MRQAATEVFRTGLGWVGAKLTDNGISRVVLPQSSRTAVLCELGLPAGRSTHVNADNPSRSRDLQRVVARLERYLSGVPVTFDLSLDLGGSTAFQRKVWRAAQAIPYGETRSYGWIAKRIRNPKAVRAVGQALGANPVPLIIP